MGRPVYLFVELESGIEVYPDGVIISIVWLDKRVVLTKKADDGLLSQERIEEAAQASARDMAKGLQETLLNDNIVCDLRCDIRITGDYLSLRASILRRSFE